MGQAYHYKREKQWYDNASAMHKELKAPADCWFKLVKHRWREYHTYTEQQSKYTSR